jgi:hypothetical protein
MDDSAFDALEDTFRCQGPEAVLDLVIAAAHREKNHRMLFGARIMQVRRRLGLPLIDTGPVPEVTDEHRPAYEKALTEAARETGELLLASGDIAAAWQYFKAIDAPAPVADAIQHVNEGENLDRIIEIAFREGVNRRKGFELILKHHGICSAITWFGSNPDSNSRQYCLELLVRRLYSDVAAALKETIAATEGTAPPTDAVAELMANRPWLFEGTSSYVDSTHLTAVTRFALELEDPATLRMALDLADYGQHLNPMFHFRGDPPFEDTYLDHAIYLRALLGEDVDVAIAHFGKKIVGNSDTSPAEALVGLLVRLGRYEDAIEASLRYLPDSIGTSQSCTPVLQLCQMAGDYSKLRRLAQESGDLLGFAAGMIQEGNSRPGFVG